LAQVQRSLSPNRRFRVYRPNTQGKSKNTAKHKFFCCAAITQYAQGGTRTAAENTGENEPQSQNTPKYTPPRDKSDASLTELIGIWESMDAIARVKLLATAKQLAK